MSVVEIERLTLEVNSLRAQVSAMKECARVYSVMSYWHDTYAHLKGLPCIACEAERLRDSMTKTERTDRNPIGQTSEQVVLNEQVDKTLSLASEVANLRAQVEEKNKALAKAAQWFSEYAEIHDAKGDTAKAIRNWERAVSCYIAIDATGKAKECSDETPRFCPMCNGRGVIPCTDPEGEDGRKRCDHCYGEGVITD